MPARSGLDQFLTANSISSSELSRLTGISRKHIITLRHGRGNPTEKTMSKIADACSFKLGSSVSISDAFFSAVRLGRRKAS